MKYLEYEPCCLGTPGRLESLPDYLAELALSPLAFPVASGSTCPLLSVSPITTTVLKGLYSVTVMFTIKEINLLLI
jgi:hypothetical protein